MKKALFLGGQRTIDWVYSEKTRNELLAEADFPLGGTVLTEKDLEENKDAIKDVSFIFSTWGMPELTEEQIERYFPELEAVFYGAGSVQDFARPFLNRGIKIFSAWVANAVPVAEYTFSVMTLANTGFFTGHRQLAEGPSGWHHSSYTGNYDATFGFISFGMISRMAIDLVKKNLENIRILVSSTSLTKERAEELGLELADIPTIFREADVISNHLANNEHTVGMLNKDVFRLMKPNATFVNTGRGAQVVEQDLIDALKECPERTAVLDVTWPEPPAADSPLYSMPNVYMTPHVAGSLGNEVHRMAQYMLDEYRLYVSGQPTRYEVTLKMLEKMA
ncbi:MAG: hydroxyacid dehydrogenase [Clostridia bacterium]|nr:hydroxyacid dehydrogenase [Clostridia bacterium]